MIRHTLAAVAAFLLTISAAQADTRTQVTPFSSLSLSGHNNLAYADLPGRIDTYLEQVRRLQEWNLGVEVGAAMVRPQARPDDLVQRHELSQLPTTLVGASNLMCMAVSLYHEARGEGAEGMDAVASVVMNRVGARNHLGQIRWGSTICDVTVPKMFSYLSDDLSFEPITEYEAWIEALDIATIVMVEGPNPFLFGADHYHTVNVDPDWNDDMPVIERIGAHIFYADPRTASLSS